MFKNILGLATSIGIVGILSFLIISAGHQFKMDEANKPQNFSASTVQLGHFCSGTVIDDPNGQNKPTILTAKHCVVDLVTGEVEKEIVPITLKTYDTKGRTVAEDAINFRVVRVSDKSDLALLQSDSALFNLPTVAIFNGDLNTGDSVFAVGYPSGSVLTITGGYLGPIELVPAFGIVSKDKEFRRSTTMIAPGSSGGSLIMQTDNGPQLVGVCTGVNMMIPFMTYWTPIEEIREFLSNQSFEEVIEANE